MGKLMVVVARFFLFRAVLLALPTIAAAQPIPLAVQRAEPAGISGSVTDIQKQELAGSQFNYQLLKQKFALWADGRGDVILERTLQNVDIINWSNTTWYFDWHPGKYSKIRAWDDSGPLNYSTSQSGTRIDVTVNFRRLIQPGENYHFSLAITIANVASVSGTNGRAYWYIYPGSPIQKFVESVTFPSNSTIQNIAPAATSQNLNDLKWRYTNTPADWQFTIDVHYLLSQSIDVLPFLQTDMPWEDDPYGRYPDNDTVNTIRKWGCTMTSAAMIINYWGGRGQPAFTTDPRKLNAWLRSNGGYDAGNGVIWSKVIQYATDNRVTLSNPKPYSLWERTPEHDKTLNDYLLSGNPVVLGVNKTCSADGRCHAGHFVVATGKIIGQNGQETYTINDPLSGKTTLAKYNDDYYQVQLLSGTPADKRTLSVSAHSPVELLVTDPKSRRFGYDPATGALLSEIPHAKYTVQSILADGIGPEQLPISKLVNIYTPIDGQYTITIVGTGSGDYTINVAASNWLGKVSQQTVNGTAQPGSSYSQTIDYSSYVGVGCHPSSLGDTCTRIDFDTLPDGTPTSDLAFSRVAVDGLYSPLGVNFRGKDDEGPKFSYPDSSKSIGLDDTTRPPGGTFNIVAEFLTPTNFVSADVLSAADRSVRMTAKDASGAILGSTTSSPETISAFPFKGNVALSGIGAISTVEFEAVPDPAVAGVEIDNLTFARE